MASDSIPSFRTRIKNKLKVKIEKHNITLFIPQNSTSNDTNNNSWRQKFTDIKGVAKNLTHYEFFKNKTKGLISSDDNQTTPNGFYDSLFNPTSDNDFYLKVTVICLWVIAITCIIPTIITIFLPAKNGQSTAKSAKQIFFHIFLCEFCYLIYILLAWINVAVNFQLISFFCDIANYGVYVTIPVMQIALLLLSIERITNRFKTTLAWVRIFTKVYVVQLILCVIWAISIAIIMTIILIRKQFSSEIIKNKIENLAPSILSNALNKMVSRPYQCSIDGRLSSIFKILLIILFIILIILIIKSMVFSIGYNFLMPKCGIPKRPKQSSNNRRITILFVIFLLLNLFFTFPFYFISIFDNIFTRITSTKTTYTNTVKVCFILRLLSIIFECLTYCTFEKRSWELISKMFYLCTCKKINALKKVESDGDDDDDDDDHPKKSPSKKSRRSSDSGSEDKEKMIDHTGDDEEVKEDDERFKQELAKQLLKAKQNEQAKKAEIYQTGEDDNKKPREEPKRQKSKVKKPEIIVKAEVYENGEDDDNEFPEEPKKQQPKVKKSEAKRTTQIDQEDGDEKPVVQKSKSPKRKKAVATRSSQESDDDEEEEEEEEEDQVPIPKATTKSGKTNGTAVHISNGKPSSHRTSSPTTDHKTTKLVPNTDQNNTKRRSTQPTPSQPPPDEVSDDSIASDVETKPSTKAEKRTTPVVSNGYHRTKSMPSSRPTVRSLPRTTSHHHNHVTTTKQRHKSPRNMNDDKEKPKKDRLSKIMAMSDDV